MEKLTLFSIGLKMFWGIKKVKKTVEWTYVIEDFNGEEIAGKFNRKKLQKKNQTEFEVEKVIKKSRCDKLHVKWKGYDDSYNRCIDKKDVLK